MRRPARSLARFSKHLQYFFRSLATPRSFAPGHRWPAARVEDTEAAKRQKKRRHLAQSLAQQILRWRFHVAEKAERQMELFLGKPAQAGQSSWVR